MNLKVKIVITSGILLCFAIIAYALGVYFLEDRFNTDDAAPVSDPYTSTGGQSIDVIQVENTLAIASGKMTLSTQAASPVDGESGIRFATTKASYIGAATFGKIVYKTLANGIAAAQNGSNWFGFTNTDNTAAVGFALNAGTAARTSIGTNATQFLMWPQETVANAWILPETPVVDDTFLLAVVLGGSDEGATGVVTATPWYTGAGLNLANYNEGHFVFVKQGTGPWLLQGVNPTNSNTPYIPVIGNYNSTLEVYDWLVIGDTDSAYYPYLQPLHYQSCNPAAGQLFDDIPEVGAQWDSVSEDYTFSSGVLINGGAGSGIATVECGDDDVIAEYITNINNTATGNTCGIVLRRNPSTGAHILIDLSTTTDALRILTHNGTSYTQRTTSSVTMAADANFKLMIGGAVIDSTVVAWYVEGTEVVSSKYTSATNTLYGSNNTDHGIRGPNTGTGIKFIRFYAAGNDGEYAGLSNFFTNSKKIITFQ